MTRCYVLDGLHIFCRYFGLPLSFLLYSPHRSPCMIWIWMETHVRYNLPTCNSVWYHLAVTSLYNINLRATHTTILSSWGVTIPICFVSSAMDSIKRHVVLFKPVTILTSDPKSEFLCQSSSIAQNLQTPLKHLVRLGYLPHPRQHVSPLRPQSKCSYRVPQAESYSFSMPNDLVVATQLKSGQTFHSNITQGSWQANGNETNRSSGIRRPRWQSLVLEV